MLNVVYAECLIYALYAKCRYADCHYAECCYAECRGAGKNKLERWFLVIFSD
jgi:hypothetical protein